MWRCVCEYLLFILHDVMLHSLFLGTYTGVHTAPIKITEHKQPDVNVGTTHATSDYTAAIPPSKIPK